MPSDCAMRADPRGSWRPAFPRCAQWAEQHPARAHRITTLCRRDGTPVALVRANPSGDS